MCRVIEEDNTIKEYHYLSADCGMFGIFVKTNGVGKLYYTLADHLGSLTEIIDASTSLLVKSQSFGAWGTVRDANDWSQSLSGAEVLADRGFTGHEHLPAVFGLIDMNGRMYDPVLGRFLSPDPYVQSPDYAQNFNRYAYCINNPLIYTDPSGELIPFLIPSMSYSQQGGLEVSLTFGAGLTEMLSASKTIGYNFKSGDYYLTNNAQIGPLYAYYGTHSDAGFIAGAGIGFNPFGSSGLSTNLTSSGINWSQKYGVSYNHMGLSIDKNGNSSFNPSIGYSNPLQITRSPSSGEIFIRCGCPPPEPVFWLDEVTCNAAAPSTYNRDLLYFHGQQRSWQSEYREYYNDYKRQQWAAQEQAQQAAYNSGIYSVTNGAANFIAATGGAMFAAGALASVPAATYSLMYNTTANATLNTAARLYGISSKGANLMTSRAMVLGKASIEVQAGIGAGVGYLNSQGAGVVTGIPLIDYAATATQFAITSYDFLY